MSEKTILKLYENGDVESFVSINYGSGISFSENSITIPQIIEYPPSNYRNYFIEKTSESGYLDNSGLLIPPTEDDRTSDFISVAGWENCAVRVRFENMHGNYRAWVGIMFYNASKQFIQTYYDNFASSQGQRGDIAMDLTFPVNVAFIRVAVTHYDSDISSVKLSVERGVVATEKHYLAFEDMPEWVKDTGNPVSIFPEGIVIKGSSIQSDS